MQAILDRSTNELIAITKCLLRIVVRSTLQLRIHLISEDTDHLHVEEVKHRIDSELRAFISHERLLVACRARERSMR